MLTTEKSATGCEKGCVKCFMKVPHACLGSRAAGTLERILQNLVHNLTPQTVRYERLKMTDWPRRLLQRPRPHRRPLRCPPLLPGICFIISRKVPGSAWSSRRRRRTRRRSPSPSRGRTLPLPLSPVATASLRRPLAPSLHPGKER